MKKKCLFGIGLTALLAGCSMTPEKYRNRINQYIASDNYQACIQLSAEFIAKNPNNGEGYFYQGACYRLKGEYAKSIPELKRALQMGLSPKQTDQAYRGIAFASKNLGQYDPCLEYLNKAAASPGFDLWEDRGECYYKKEMFDKAIEDFGRAIVNDPKDRLAYFYRGMAHEAQKNYAGAVSDLKEAKRLGILMKDGVNLEQEISKLQKLAPQGGDGTTLQNLIQELEENP